MVCHECDVFEDALADDAHVGLLEAQELELFADLLQIDVLEAVLFD